MQSLTASVEGTQFTRPEPIQIQDQKVEKFYNDLLRGLTHKLNNLYAVVQGFSSLIMMNEDLDESVQENIHHMKEAAQNASSLMEKILTVGGCSKAGAQTIRLDDYMGMVGSGLRKPLEDSGVPFNWNVSPDLPNITADPTRFKELLTELLKNAREAAKAAGGEVSLEIVPSRQPSADGTKRVDVFITNTGSEIPQEKINDCFRPFYTTKSSEHPGIGLTIASVLADQMNMPLSIHSGNNSVTLWVSCPEA